MPTKYIAPLPGGLQFSSAVVWCRRDEDRLQHLRKELGELEKRREAGVATVREVLSRCGIESDLILSRLIADADAIRDALQPFDSGVREELS